MNTDTKACEMRANGKTFSEIARKLGISIQHAYRCASTIEPNPVEPTHKTTVRYGAFNGGCSTQSGMRPVSLPRVPTIDGAFA